MAKPRVYRFGSWEKDQPIFRPLSDPQQGDLRRVTVRQLTKLRPMGRATVLARAGDGEPLLVEGRRGRGVVLLVATEADRDWGDWPQGRLYVPLVHQLAGYLTERLPESQRVREAPCGPGAANPPGVEDTGNGAIVRTLTPDEASFRRTNHLPEERVVAGATAAGTDGLRPDEVWVYVVWVLLAVLVVEWFVANRSTA